MPKKNKNYLLERQVENQGKSIKQLLGEIEDLKVKTTRYMEQAHKYRAELNDLRAVNDSLEESIGQKNEQLTQLFSENKSISEKIEEVLKELAVCKQNFENLRLKAMEIEEKKSGYFSDLVAKERECRNLRLEIEELKKPWYKKILRRG